MKNNLRQKILNELKFLLKEQDAPANLPEDLPNSSTTDTTAPAKNGVLTYEQCRGFAKELVTPLDGWVDDEDIGAVQLTFNKFVGLKAEDRNGNIYPAMVVVAYLYSRDESDDKLEKDIKAIGSSTLSTESMDKLDALIDLVDKYLPNGTPEKLGGAKPTPESAASKPPVAVAPAEEPYTQVAAGKFSFACRDPLTVGIYQQFLGVPVDCKVGKKTIEAQVAKTKKNISLEEYFGNPPSAQQLANQKLFCDNLVRDIEKYKTAVTNASGKPIAQCPAASAVKKGVSPTTKNKVMFNQMSEKTKQLIKKLHPNILAVDYAYKNETKWVLNIPNNSGPDDNQGALVTQKELYDSIQQDANKGVQILQQRLEENYYDNKKLVEAKQLFNKLLKSL